jgi:hypothetical protein
VAPTVLVSGQSSPSNIVLDATTLYFVAGGAIASIPIGGGPATVLVKSQSWPASLASDTNHLFWTENSPSGAVMQSSLDGTSRVQLASNELWPSEIAVDATHVYWNDVNSGKTKRAPIGGGATELVAASNNFLYDLALDSTNIYVGQNPPVKIPKTGGNPQPLTGAGYVPYSIAIDAGWLYCSDHLGGIRKVPLAGGPWTPLATQLPNAAMMVAIDATSIYWTDNQAIMKLDKNGGTPIALASGQDTPVGIAVDASNVYWSTSVQNGSILKTPK